MRQLRGTLDGSKVRVALVVSRYNESVTRGLLEGALDELRALKVPEERVTVCEVPGALELAVVAQALARGGGQDCIVALGCVIRGETDHYEHVSSEAVRGCTTVALATGVPVACGVLTCETLQQARDRSGAGPKNKGREAAWAAVETAGLLATLRAEGSA
jgi:6,7-dimethyl-8-ribityllumazine synthase